MKLCESTLGYGCHSSSKDHESTRIPKLYTSYVETVQPYPEQKMAKHWKKIKSHNRFVFPEFLQPPDTDRNPMALFG